MEQLEDFFEQPIDSSPSRKPKSFIPPAPGSVEFWKHYRESLVEVYLSTRRFVAAADVLAKFESEAATGAHVLADARSAH
jgi:hypothetical protein